MDCCAAMQAARNNAGAGSPSNRRRRRPQIATQQSGCDLKRRGDAVNELWPQAEANDMELAATRRPPTVAALRFPATVRGRQSCRFLETASLYPPPAALRRFPRHARYARHGRYDVIITLSQSPRRQRLRGLFLPTGFPPQPSAAAVIREKRPAVPPKRVGAAGLVSAHMS